MKDLRALTGFFLLAAILSLAARLDAPGLSPASEIQAWVLEAGAFKPAGLEPETARGLWKSSGVTGQVQNHLKIDGIYLEVRGGRAEIHRGPNPHSDQPEWVSPPGWQVTQAELTDLDGDGQVEAALLVWRPYAPWPIDSYLPRPGRIENHQDAAGQSCHLILLELAPGGVREKWAGSALARPLTGFTAADLDGDGRQELLALQSDYPSLRSAPAQAITAWEWNGFGFSLLARLPLVLVEARLVGTGGQAIILTR